MGCHARLRRGCCLCAAASVRRPSGEASRGADGGARLAAAGAQLPGLQRAVEKALSRVVPKGATLHFTFGSGTMMQFLRNWRHYIVKAGIAPAIVGAADADMLAACTAEAIGATGIVQDLDVWTYEKMKGTSNVQGEASGCGKVPNALEAPL